MDEDEVCMLMSAEIEEIEYSNEVICSHKEFESCHSTFKSVLRKSMVKSPFRKIILKKLNGNLTHFLYCRWRSVRLITSRSAILTMRLGPNPSKWRSAKNPGQETVMSKEK